MSNLFISYFLIFLFPLIGIIFITVILCYMKSNRLVIRRDIDGKSIIDGYYWMLPKKDKKDGTIWWVSVPWQKKLKIQEPPNEVMDINPRGKKWVEVFRLSEDEYCFIKNAGLKKENITERYDPNNKETGMTKGTKNVFQPFSLVQRETVIQQYKKANAEQTKDKLMMLINNIPVIVLGMVIILGMIYAGDISTAFSKVGGQAEGLITKATKLLQSTQSAVGDIVPQQSDGISQASEEPPRE